MAKKKKPAKKAPTTEVKKRKAFLRDIHLPRWAILVIVACILAVIVFLRLSYLSYDPPGDIFWSQDLWTDPPQYTSYARSAVLFDSWNPLDENMYLPFRRNSMGPVAYVVFSIFGTGFWQSNFAGVLFSLGAIFFFSLAVTRLKNQTAGILCALLLGVNYIFLTYGRVPFLENAMNFWLALAVFFAARGLGKPRWAIAAGLAVGLAAFFGKMIALHALPALLIFALFVNWRDSGKAQSKPWYFPAIYLAVGFVVVAVFWYLYVYSSIEGSYFAEKSTALYGSPEGLQSITGFFNRLFSFGSDTRLFIRLPVMAAFGFIGLALAFLPLACRGKFAERLRRINPGYLLVGLWFWAAYLALMPWNYRPLRYQTVLLLPLAGAAAMILSHLLRRARGDTIRPAAIVQLWSIVLGTVFFALPVYHLITVHFTQPPMGTSDPTSVFLAIVISLAGAFLVSVSWKQITFGWQRLISRVRLPEIIIAVAVIAAFASQGRMIVRWWEHGQQAMATASRDLGQVLGPDAVLVGSYATGLTLENQLNNVVYMFGVANINHTLFHDYPITHLAVIDDNRKGRVFTDYPEIAGRARRVTSYVIGNRPVGIFRVAEHSPNEKARKYQATAYENAMRCYDIYDEDSMLIYINRFAQEHPDNYNVHRFRGLYFMRDSTFDSASLYFEKALDIFPDDYATQQRLGHCEMVLFEQTGNVTHMQKAQKHFREVLRLRPNDPALRASLEPIVGR